MESIGDGGAAFPTSGSSGMSLRDWFAGQAVPTALKIVAHEPKLAGNSNGDLFRAVAAIAYSVADAMLAERSKK